MTIRFSEKETPCLIAIGGVSGSGKSSLACRLAAELSPPSEALVLRSDILRKALFHRSPTETLPPQAYTPMVSRRVFAEMGHQARRMLAEGHTVILDAVFGAAYQRWIPVRTAARAGVPFLGLWLSAPEPILAARIAGRRGDASDATVAVMRRQRRSIPPSPPGWHALAAARTEDKLVAEAKRWVRRATRSSIQHSDVIS